MGEIAEHRLSSEDAQELFEPATARRVQRIIQYEPAPPYAAEV